MHRTMSEQQCEGWGLVCILIGEKIYTPSVPVSLGWWCWTGGRGWKEEVVTDRERLWRLTEKPYIFIDMYHQTECLFPPIYLYVYSNWFIIPGILFSSWFGLFFIVWSLIEQHRNKASIPISRRSQDLLRRRNSAGFYVARTPIEQHGRGSITWPSRRRERKLFLFWSVMYKILSDRRRNIYTHIYM